MEEVSENNYANFEDLEDQQKSALLEAMLFANAEPLPVSRISEILAVNESIVEEMLVDLKQKYTADSFGIELIKIANKYQLRTKNTFADWVSQLKSLRPRRLSLAALETLAVIAYRQPVVKSDIEKIRGVDATPTLKTLLERGLIKIIGYQTSVGQPALYGTTEEFMNIFGLESLGQLPTLREIKEIEQDPGEPGQVFITNQEPVSEFNEEESGAI